MEWTNHVWPLCVWITKPNGLWIQIIMRLLRNTRQSIWDEMKFQNPQIKRIEWGNLAHIIWMEICHPKMSWSRAFVYHFANLLQPQAFCRLGNYYYFLRSVIFFFLTNILILCHGFRFSCSVLKGKLAPRIFRMFHFLKKFSFSRPQIKLEKYLIKTARTSK